MKRIGLIELKCRNHELSGLCKISNTRRNKVTVFTTTSLFPQVKEELKGKIEDYEWILNKENESILSFLKRIEKICDDRIDLVIVNSLRSWQFMFFKPKCKMISIIYDLNYWFKDTKSLKVYFKKMMDKVNIMDTNPMANVISGPIIRNILLSHYDGIIVEYPPFKQYIRDNFKYEKRIYSFPNTPFGGIHHQQIGNVVRFAIPGMIQRGRRNYDLILRAFEDLFPIYKESVELYLLGKPVGEYGKIILSYCEKLKEKGYKIFCSKEYVPPEIFEESLYKSDVIISPMQLRYRSRCVEEIYTVTKGTGTFSDAIKYAKPVIVPETYNVADEIKTSYLAYKDEEDLRGILESIICDREKLESLKKEALNNSRKFSLEKLHEKFDVMVEELLGEENIMLNRNLGYK